MKKIWTAILLAVLLFAGPGRAQLSMMNIGGGDLGGQTGTPCTTTGLKFNLACNTQYLF